MNDQNISSALLIYNRDYLLQLRDFNEQISFPGMWGLFGGHIEKGETWERALARELCEELGISVTPSEYIGKIEIPGFQIHLGLVRLHGEFCSLDLREGQEIGVFSLKQIVEGRLVSKKYNKNYTLTPGCKAAFEFYQSLDRIEKE